MKQRLGIDASGGRRSALAGLCLLGTVALFAGGCPPPPPPPPSPTVELHPLSLVSAEYWAEADGQVTLSDESGETSAPGRVRVWYSVDSDGAVKVSRLFAWMDDLDLSIPFLWWKTEVEKLRCTTFRNLEPFDGSLDGTQISLAAGANILGVTHSQRNSKGECGGKGRKIEASSPGSIVLSHQPDDDSFGFVASFEVSAETEGDDQPFTIAFSAQGEYLNRPPVAVLEVKSSGIELNENGCPGLTKEVPPIAVANSAAGLELELRSASYDLDGIFSAGSTPKRPRIDIAREQWARSKGEKLVPLGAGVTTGPLLFETGREHQVLLWITDRQGAEARKFCHFQVVEAS